MSCSKDSTRLGSFAPSRLLRIEPLEDRRLLEFEVTMVAEASVPSGLHGIESQAIVNETLFFTGLGGRGLWKSDGTAASTHFVVDIQKEGVSQVLYSLTDVNGTLYFRIARAELWKSDGSAAGTILVKDFGPEAFRNSYLSSLTNVSDTLYFRVDDGTRGVELWKSEGTESGTVIVKDIWPGAYR